MMLNKFENYQQQQQQQQQQQRCSGVVIPTPPTPPQTMQCSADYAAAAAAASKAERESIHSGQFMVSHFEAEEAQDDLEEYDEVKMLDPEDPNLSKHDDPATPCMEVQLYVPRHVSHSQEQGVSSSMVTSHLEIETSLTKLFKCMNLAYSQKLTSPKWNHFKGVRLRWKDKIRLNNVIWRCWHMQFILKRRTPVCQFASPLDVDIHSNPQAVVLEGKYWKRQTTVIKAEYRKWRRNYKSKATGCLIYDTKSELDFLEWSPLNDRTLMISEDWTSDTLFSSINGPFPFPDPREIARGAGIADFMQPGLSSLQPNIDDIDLTIDELLQTSRLPPVPEEGADEMLKSVDYGFSAIMGSDQMDSNSIIDVSANSVGQLSGNDDTNMLDLNTPLGTMQFSDAEQQFVVRESGNSSFIDAQTTNRTMGLAHTMISDERTSALLAEAVATVTTATTRPQNKHFAAANDNIGGRHNNNEFPSKSVMKGRISKSFQRPFRREPHNYDKAQPTMHQTTIYQQMLAEQQKSQQTLQQHLQPVISSFQQAIACQQQQQQQQQLQYSSNQYQTVQNMLDGGSNSNNYSGYSGDITSSLGGTTRVGNSVANVPGTNAKPKNYNVVQTGSNVSTTNLNSTVASTPGQGMLLNVKTEPDVLSMYNLAATNEVYGSGGGGVSVSNNGSNNLNSYKPYPSVGSFKKSASTGTYINVRVSPNAYMQEQATTSHMHAQSLPLSLGTQVPLLPSALQLQAHAQGQLSPTSSQHHHRQQQQQQQQPHLGAQQQMQQRQQTTNSIMPKEMFRSNSLPLNVTLQKLDVRSSHDNFAVPKYHAKSNKPRSRSNSIHQHIIGNNGVGGNNSNNGLMVSSQLQAATSDPMLNNSTLAQLLTTSSRKTSLAKQQSSSTSAISTLNMPMTTVPMPAAAAAAVTIPVSKIQNVNVSGSKYFMSPPQCSPILSPLMGSLATTGATATPPETLQRQSTQIQQQQKSPKKSASLPTPVATPLLHSPPSKMLSYPPTAGAHTAACTNTISLSPDSFHDQDSPLSPTHSLKFPRENQRRAGHIHAEQKRRYNIKNGFDVLHSLIPQLQQNPNAKLSKAAMLQKGADHIKHLRSERNQLNDRMDALLKERDALNNSLTHLHSILPANGAPVTRQGTEHVRQLYEQYVRHRTLENWKFWILGLILEPLLSSYTASVSSASMEELRRTAFLWVDQHCSLVDLRPAVSNKLKYLSMKTDILSDPPSTLQEEVAKAVQNTTGQHPNLHGT